MENAERPKKRWSRGDRFVLSPEGEAAEAAYRATIEASRTESGRASFDAARAEWAETFSVQPDDGVYLGEIRSGPVDLNRLVSELEPCGHSKQNVHDAMARLVDAGLVTIAQS